jgi:hypothetical protein
MMTKEMMTMSTNSRPVLRPDDRRLSSISKPLPYRHQIVGAAVKPREQEPELEAVPIPAASEYFGSSLAGGVVRGEK